MYKEEEVYLGDMILKSKERDGHVLTLWKFSTRLRKYNMHLNSPKYVVRVTSWNLLGYMVSLRLIEVKPSKTMLIQEMLPPRLRRKYKDS